MRLFLVLAVIGGIGFWCYRTATNGFDASAIKGGMNFLQSKTASVVKPNVKGGPSSSSRAAGKPASDSLAVVGAPPDPVAKASRTYAFKFREPPAQNELVSMNSAGVSVLIDSVTRSALCVGTVEGVDIAMRHLAAIDQAPGSCSVRTWAVYVDRSQVKGWDLVAAINSLLSGGAASLVVGSGGLVLDADVGKISAALEIVCDGSVVEVIHRPHVQLQHAAVAKIESLQEVPVPSTTVSQGISQTSITYRKVGLQLDVTPYFYAGNRVRLAVVQTNGLIGQNVKIDGNDIPIIQSQTVSTSCELAVGQTVILGGVSTLRQKSVRGFLRNKTEVSEGALYVILSTYYDAPKAVKVGAAALADPPALDDVPLLPPMDDPRGWLEERNPLPYRKPVLVRGRLQSLK
jgi:hypothetical protein